MNYRFLKCSFFLSFPFLFISCIKDVDRHLAGNYKGTARFKLYRYADVINPITDTLYENAEIQVNLSENSKQNNVKLNISFMPSQMMVAPLENITVSDGHINMNKSDRGVTTSHQWSGHILHDSINLFYKVEDHVRYVREYYFKAYK